MIGKVSRGDDAAGLLRYLLGPGRANEHTNPHVVAGWDDAVLADRLTGGQPRVRQLAALLEQPLVTLNSRPTPVVWHCSLRTAPSDRRLTDAEWADVAADVLHRTGLAPYGDGDGCRWVAVRHAEDHIHIALTLARQDGRRARTPHDYVRVGAACRAAEQRYGLRVTPPRDRTAPKRPTRSETEKAIRQGLSETARQRLRREVRRAALASADLPGFVERLQASGVQVRLRSSDLDPTVVTGYAVADGIDRAASGDLVWFGGGKLAPQLSLTRLSSAWAQTAGRSSSASDRPAMRSPRKGIQRSLLTAATAARHLERGQSEAVVTVLAVAAVQAVGRRRR